MIKITTKNSVEPNSYLKFSISLVAAFCVTASYPTLMLVEFPTEHVFEYLRNEVAWSFHAVFLIPIAVGLFARAFNLGFLFELEFWTRCAWVLGFLVPVFLLFFAVRGDTEVIPTADRVTSANGLQNFAIEVDQCLRNQACKEANTYLGLVQACRSKYGAKYSVLQPPAYLEKSKVESFQKSFEKGQAYFCALLEKRAACQLRRTRSLPLYSF
jgi:hypothetical protein